MPTIKNNISTLSTIADKFFEQQDEIILLNVCTSDGFNLYSKTIDENFIEEDKISAIASSLGSLANSSSKLITGHDAIVTTIESDGGHVVFQRSTLKDQPIVVAIATNPKLSLAHVRFFLKKVADTIENI